MKRLFIAIDLPEPLKNLLYNLPVDTNQFRPVPKGQLHITLFFLGDTNEDMIPVIIGKLSCIRADAFTVYTDAPGVFPSFKNPRVLWIGLNDPEAIENLNRQITKKVGACNPDALKKKYIPHITVARAKRKYCKANNFLNHADDLAGEKIMVRSFQLFESRLTHKRAVHHILKTFDLQ